MLPNTLGYLLFPAVSEDVIATGSLNNPLLESSGINAVSWETPPLETGPRAVMPGTGVCLEDEHEVFWPLPAGSSISSAIATAWIAAAMRDHGPEIENLLILDGRWEPKQICDPLGNCEYLLSHGSSQFPTPRSAAGELVFQAVHGNPSLCGVRQGQDLSLTAVRSLEDPTSGYLSMPELVAEFRTLPEPRPYVPCSMACQINGTPPALGPAFTETGARTPAPFSKARQRTKVVEVSMLLMVDMFGQPSLISILEIPAAGSHPTTRIQRSTPIIPPW